MAGHPILRSTFERWELAAVKSEKGAVASVPPAFSACVEHSLAVAAAKDPTAPKPNVSLLRRGCAAQYQEFATAALDRLISDDWDIYGAGEAGVHLTQAEIDKNLEEFKHEEGLTTAARYRAFLAAAGRSPADVVFETEADLARKKMRKAVLATAQPVTPARIAAYYQEHRSAFYVPQLRDLEIVRAPTLAAALHAKQELASGASFASIVRKSKLTQPIYSSNGTVLGLRPGVYHEKALDRAIFEARPRVLTGPVKIILGYYVFEVKRIQPAYRKPLAEEEAGIHRELIALSQETALASFIEAWRRRWIARTDCAPKYVVLKCSEYKGGRLKEGLEFE